MAEKKESLVKGKSRYFILQNGQYVNVENLPQEEQDVIRKNFSEQLADALMEGFGYSRVDQSSRQ